MAGALAIFGGVAQAEVITPNFADAPTGWGVDRYQPDSFEIVSGPIGGRTNVLGIGISSEQGSANRGGRSSGFYNTHGYKHAVTGGAGSSLVADLWLPSDWASEANGSRRTDMWGVMTDGSGVSAYTIIGFTNFGGEGRFQVWDSDEPGNWISLDFDIDYDAWYSLEIAFTGSEFVYSINGSVVHIDNAIGGTTGFSDVIMQAYNFYNPNDPNISGAVTQDVAGNNIGDYVAYWSNTTAVPEPGSLALLGTGLLGFLAFRRRQAATA